MKRTVTDCDMCGKRAVDCCSVNIPYDRKMCAAGSMDTSNTQVDFCLACAGNILSNVFAVRHPAKEKVGEYEDNKVWLEKHIRNWQTRNA